MTDFAFNGGGKGGCYDETRTTGGGGGGTDVRVLGNEYIHRILVAGGGGGSTSLFTPENLKTDGGYGGGKNGETVSYAIYHANGASQDAPGIGDEKNVDIEQNQKSQSGKFGEGGSGTDVGTHGGGGGGWYGGASGGPGSGCGGGGGSGFILTSSSVVNTPDDYPLKASSSFRRLRVHFNFIIRCKYT